MPYLYAWEHFRPDWTDGLLVVVAESVEQAREWYVEQERPKAERTWDSFSGGRDWRERWKDKGGRAGFIAYCLDGARGDVMDAPDVVHDLSAPGGIPYGHWCAGGG